MKIRKPQCLKNKYHKVDYFTEFDAYCCIECNEWLERTCSDSHCEFCLDRPEKPV